MKNILSLKTNLILIALLITFSSFGQTTNNKDSKNQMSNPDSIREFFMVTEVMPEFVGGKSALTNFINSNKGSCNSTGKVYLNFLVYDDGTINDIKIMKGISENCDQEAERIVKSMPKWNPGIQRGQPVNVQMHLVIEF